MFRSSRSHVLYLAASLIVSGAGCEKGGSKSGVIPGKVEGAAITALDVLPKDAVVVIGVNWAKLRDNKYLQQLNSQAPAEAKKILEGFKKSCDIDLWNELESLVVAGPGDMDKAKASIIIKGKWTEEKVAECAAKTTIEGKKLTVAKGEDGITTFTLEGMQPFHVAWVAKDTMLLTGTSVRGDKTLLTEVLKKKTSLKQNEKLHELLQKCDTTASVWVAALPFGPLEMVGSQLPGANNAKIEGIYLTVDFIKDLDLSIGLRLDKDAKSVAGSLDKELGELKSDEQFGKFVKKVSVGNAGNDVTVRVALTEKDVEELVALVKPFLGMLIPGM
jgi:hypothetical protein